MVQKRLSKGDRRQSIIVAATRVFAAQGFNGATTIDIAKAAGVSEALLYRHFASKKLLYRAALRVQIEKRDEIIANSALAELSSVGLVGALTQYLGACIRVRPGSDQSIRRRIMFSSLAGDREYARMAYQRAARITMPAFKKAMETAWEAGELRGEPIDVTNAFYFIDHVGAMIMVARLGGASLIPYSGDEAHLLRQALWFCGRGLGLTEEALAKYFPPAVLAGDKPAVALRAKSPAVKAPKRRKTSQ